MRIEIAPVNTLHMAYDKRVFGRRYGSVLGKEFPRFGDQHLGEYGEDAPVSSLVRIRERRTGDGSMDSQMVQFQGNGTHAGFNVPKSFSRVQLGECHAQELIEAGERGTGTPLCVSGSLHRESGNGLKSMTCINACLPRRMPPPVNGPN